MQLTVEQRTFLVEVFIRTNNMINVIDQFQERFPERDPPTTKTIKRTIEKFRDRGTVRNQNAGRSGRLRTVRVPENINLVQEIIEENNAPVTSRKNGLEITKSSFNRITKEDLNFHPYKISVRHTLENGDHERRINFCQWLLLKFQDANFMRKIVIGDEAAFCVNGDGNFHNAVRYATKGEPPDFHYDVPNSRQKVSVWAAVCGNGRILGPYFFDHNINGVSYVNMINEQVVPEMNEIYDFNLFGDVHFQQNVWWFQDGAPCHRQVIVTERLHELFGNQIVALNQEIEWPPRSPDLTPCDFFLWGELKARVYKSPSPNVIVLRQKIINEFERLQNDQELILRVVRSMEKRARACIERHGGHVEGNFA